MRNISEYKSISSKITREEFTLIENYCKKKDVTPSSLIRDLLLQEIKVPVPHNVAGRNVIEYNKEKDNFSWSIKLDDSNIIRVIPNMSTEYLEDLSNNLSKAFKSREGYIQKSKADSVALPTNLMRRKI